MPVPAFLLIYFHKNRDARKKPKQTNASTRNIRLVETVSISNVSYLLSGDVRYQRYAHRTVPIKLILVIIEISST